MPDLTSRLASPAAAALAFENKEFPLRTRVPRVPAGYGPEYTFKCGTTQAFHSGLRVSPVARLRADAAQPAAGHDAWVHRAGGLPPQACSPHAHGAAARERLSAARPNQASPLRAHEGEAGASPCPRQPRAGPMRVQMASASSTANSKRPRPRVSATCSHGGRTAGRPRVRTRPTLRTKQGSTREPHWSAW